MTRFFARVAVVICIGCHDEASVATNDANAVEASVPALPEAGVEASSEIVDAAPFADAALVDMVSDAIVLLGQIGDIIAANINDCEVMATRLDAFRLAHLDGVAEVSAIYDPEHKDELKHLQPQFRARFKAAWAKVRPGIKKCARGTRMTRVIHDIWGDSDIGPMPDGGP
ncbi:MAG TPA: hypothetical protein VGH87_21765 [Polyangiaceae bacterium]